MNIEDIARSTSTTGPLRTGKDCPIVIVNQRILVQTKRSFSTLWPSMIRSSGHKFSYVTLTSTCTTQKCHIFGT